MVGVGAEMFYVEGHLFTGHRNEIEETTYVLRVGLFLLTFCGSIFYIVVSFLLLILVGILFCFFLS